MDRVFIAIPAGGASIHSKLVENLLPQLNGNSVCILTGEKPIARARNTLVKKFLETDATHIWFIDDHTIPPKNALKEMLAFNRPIVTGITPMVVEDQALHYNVFLESKNELLPIPYNDPRVKPKALSFKADACGFSCILIKREVFEKMEYPYFCDVWFQTGEYCSEDVFWCNCAKSIGYEIRVAPNIRCLAARYVVI